MDNVDYYIPTIALLQCPSRDINLDDTSWNNQQLVGLDALKTLGALKVIFVR